MQINFSLGHFLPDVSDFCPHRHLIILFRLTKIQIIVEPGNILFVIKVKLQLILSKTFDIGCDFFPIVVNLIKHFLVQIWHFKNCLGCFKIDLWYLKSISNHHKDIPNVVMVVTSYGFHFNIINEFFQLTFKNFLAFLLGFFTLYKSSHLVLCLTET